MTGTPPPAPTSKLGVVAKTQRRFAEAEASYRQALDIYLEFGDRHAAASTYHQLGTVAQEQRRFAEAEASYRQALDIFLEFGDRHSAARTYNNLGRVAQEQRRFAEAEASYRQALDIYLEFGDRHSAASVFKNLGAVAQQQHEFAQAEDAYRQALNIERDLDLRAASITASRLGNLIAQLDRHLEAVTVLLYAATTWRQETGQFDPDDLQWLNQERVLIEPAQFTALVEAHVPPDLIQEFTAIIEGAQTNTSGGNAAAGGE